jgi:gliding motility-associated-like protein
MPKRIFFAGMMLCGLLSNPACASHLVGGEFYYNYLGDTTVSGKLLQKYRVTLLIYQDCINGVADAIAQDNPAYFTAYENGNNAPYQIDTNIYYDANPASGGAIAVTVGFVSSPCGTVSGDQLAPNCLLRKKFVKDYYFPPSAAGYTVVYQRCCRSSSIINITDPGDQGVTYSCTIPGSSVSGNNSAVFKQYPPQIICRALPVQLDLSASDPDGDSLTYEFSEMYDGASNADIKPKVADPPPFNKIDFYPPYTFDNPISSGPVAQLGQTTGKLWLSPYRTGRYALAVKCNEWRNGTLINFVVREFELTISDCSNVQNIFKPDAGPDRTIVAGETVQFNATGGSRYFWLPGDHLSNAYSSDPLGSFPDPGEFIYQVTASNDSGCNGLDTVKVTVLDHAEIRVPNAFTPNGDGLNDLLIPLQSGNCVLQHFKIVNRWGNVLYQTSMPGTGWDGTTKGTPQSTGSYFWMATYTDNNGVTRTSSGNVLLIR